MFYSVSFFSSMTEKATGKNVKVLAVDFTKDDIYECVEQSLEELNIGVLGVYYLHYKCIINAF